MNIEQTVERRANEIVKSRRQTEYERCEYFME